MFGLGKTNRVDPAVAIAAVADGAAVLLDVRTASEFDDTHAVGAINFELARIAGGHMPPMGKNDAVYVYCQSGGRSAQAAMLLERAGFTNVQNLGGLHAWSSAGGPVEESDSPSVAPQCEVEL